MLLQEIKKGIFSGDIDSVTRFKEKIMDKKTTEEMTQALKKEPLNSWLSTAIRLAPLHPNCEWLFFYLLEFIPPEKLSSFLTPQNLVENRLSLENAPFVWELVVEKIKMGSLENNFMTSFFREIFKTHPHDLGLYLFELFKKIPGEHIHIIFPSIAKTTYFPSEKLLEQHVFSAVEQMSHKIVASKNNPLDEKLSFLFDIYPLIKKNPPPRVPSYNFLISQLFKKTTTLFLRKIFVQFLLKIIFNDAENNLVLLSKEITSENCKNLYKIDPEGIIISELFFQNRYLKIMQYELKNAPFITNNFYNGASEADKKKFQKSFIETILNNFSIFEFIQLQIKYGDFPFFRSLCILLSLYEKMEKNFENYNEIMRTPYLLKRLLSAPLTEEKTLSKEDKLFFQHKQVDVLNPIFEIIFSFLYSNKCYPTHPFLSDFLDKLKESINPILEKVIQKIIFKFLEKKIDKKNLLYLLANIEIAHISSEKMSETYGLIQKKYIPNLRKHLVNFKDLVEKIQGAFFEKTEIPENYFLREVIKNRDAFNFALSKFFLPDSDLVYFESVNIKPFLIPLLLLNHQRKPFGNSPILEIFYERLFISDQNKTITLFMLMNIYHPKEAFIGHYRKQFDVLFCSQFGNKNPVNVLKFYENYLDMTYFVLGDWTISVDKTLAFIRNQNFLSFLPREQVEKFEAIFFYEILVKKDQVNLSVQFTAEECIQKKCLYFLGALLRFNTSELLSLTSLINFSTECLSLSFLKKFCVKEVVASKSPEKINSIISNALSIDHEKQEKKSWACVMFLLSHLPLRVFYNKKEGGTFIPKLSPLRKGKAKKIWGICLERVAPNELMYFARDYLFYLLSTRSWASFQQLSLLTAYFTQPNIQRDVQSRFLDFPDERLFLKIENEQLFILPQAKTDDVIKPPVSSYSMPLFYSLKGRSVPPEVSMDNKRESAQNRGDKKDYFVLNRTRRNSNA